MKKCFDNNKYIKLQSAEILKRVKIFDNKLYLELGGKLFDDMHAARVLPGFKSNAKIEVLKTLRKKLEIIFCINAEDIASNKINSNVNLTYDIDLLRLIDELRNLGFKVDNVVITLFTGQPAAILFRKKLARRNIKTYIHTYTKGYPTDVDTIVSDEGYGANDYIETTEPIVLIASPGPGSGKLATALSQLYHEYKRGIKAGYAKYETFPVWNLPLKHPLNIAYETATADLKDINMIDSFHLEEYGVKAINYNRDLKIFPILNKILYKITGEQIYKSPTDMGVNMVGYCITDNEEAILAANQEMVRRYYRSLADYKKGIVDEETPQRIKILLDEANVDINIRKVVSHAYNKTKKEKVPVIAMQINSHKIITGKNTIIMTAASSLILNALKEFAHINDDINLLSPSVLEPMLKLKKEIYGNDKSMLSLQEVLYGLSICSSNNTLCEKALSKLDKLKNLEAHASFFIPIGDEKLLSNLGINLTTEPEFYSKNLFWE
ncbi:MAG: DUF1846 domain-containing protein [Tenericutes bacterium]|jgi:uncharacterized protein (UPF0371 family)|nr:DUF1846 domain-containing protein [Mycoplasmatota bacterium]